MPVLDAPYEIPAAAPEAAALDLHEGIGTNGCSRWPESFRLRSTLGELVMGRCKAVNLCDYCARLAAVETSEVLAIDAMTNSSPALWSVLTTRTATLDVAAFKYARKVVARAVRSCWPDAQSATLVEFTTGLGKRAAGARRPHWNDMWKGVPVAAEDELHAVMADAWCRHVDALPAGQYVRPVPATAGPQAGPGPPPLRRKHAPP